MLESPDLPAGWSVNEVTADPGSVTEDGDGTVIDVYRRSGVAGEWPYSAKPASEEGERARARLIPYHQWANRGPSTMRAWLPLAGAKAGDDGGHGEGGEQARARPRQSPPRVR